MRTTCEIIRLDVKDNIIKMSQHTIYSNNIYNIIIHAYIYTLCLCSTCIVPPRGECLSISHILTGGVIIDLFPVARW